MSKDIKEKARLKRNAYMREWRRKNKDKVREYQENYWERKAKEDELKDLIKDD